MWEWAAPFVEHPSYTYDQYHRHGTSPQQPPVCLFTQGHRFSCAPAMDCIELHSRWDFAMGDHGNLELVRSRLKLTTAPTMSSTRVKARIWRATSDSRDLCCTRDR